MKWRCLGTAIAGFAFSAGAQTPVNPDTQKPVILQLNDLSGFGPVGITAAMAGPTSTIAGAPYSAEAVTQQIQVLADGNRIEHTTSGNVARDSQGRVRRDEALPGFGSGNSDGPHLVTIQDPVAGVHWTLDAHNRTAVKMPLAQIKFNGPAPFVPPPLRHDKTFLFTTSQLSSPPSLAPRASQSNTIKTDLGTQTVRGVAAQGTRTVHTIPAGDVGNEQPIVITTETWYSPDLKVLVMSKTNDPRMGETTYKLTNLQRSEPPATLFQVPDDYTITEQPGNTFFVQKKSQ